MMRFKSLARIAWRNVHQSRRKTAMAVLAIGTGFASLNLFQGYIRDTERLFEDTYVKRLMLGELIVERKAAAEGSRFQAGDHLLTPAEQTDLDAILSDISGITGRVRFLDVMGSATNGKMSTVIVGYGYEVDEGLKMRAPVWSWNVVAGKPLDMSPPGDRVILGRQLGELLGCQENERLSVMTGKGGYPPVERPFTCHSRSLQLQASTVNGQANAKDVEVAAIADAIFADVDLRHVAMPLKTAQQLLDTDGVSSVSIGLADPADADGIIARISGAAKAKSHDWSVQSWRRHSTGEFYRVSLDFLHMSRNFFSLVILAIALLSVMNTQIRIVQERTREIGTLRSIGFKSRDVRTIFLLEAFFLGILGVTAGMAISIVLAGVVNFFAIPYRIGPLSEAVPFTIAISPELSAQSALVLIAISLIAALGPTEAAVRRRIVDCLVSV